MGTLRSFLNWCNKRLGLRKDETANDLKDEQKLLILSYRELITQDYWYLDSKKVEIVRAIEKKGLINPWMPWGARAPVLRFPSGKLLFRYEPNSKLKRGLRRAGYYEWYNDSYVWLPSDNHNYNRVHIKLTKLRYIRPTNSEMDVLDVSLVMNLDDN